MNPKVVAAFLAGAALAAAIVYEEVHPARTHVIKCYFPKPPPVAAAAPAVVPAPEPAPAPRQAPVRIVPVLQKSEPVGPPPSVEPAFVPVAEVVPAAPIPTPAPEPAPVATLVATPVEPPPVAQKPHTVSIAEGTLLAVRMGETLSSDRNIKGDEFLATLDQPLVVDGFVIAEKGARAEGRVIDATKGHTSQLKIELFKLSTADGQHIAIRTAAYEKSRTAHNGQDIAKAGAVAALGAIIGAAAGGGKGAAIGAAAGGVAGAGGVLIHRSGSASIPVETRISFRLEESVTVTERLD